MGRKERKLYIFHFIFVQAWLGSRFCSAYNQTKSCKLGRHIILCIRSREVERLYKNQRNRSPVPKPPRNILYCDAFNVYIPSPQVPLSHPLIGLPAAMLSPLQAYYSTLNNCIPPSTPTPYFCSKLTSLSETS